MIYLDIDGVLADFVGGLSNHFDKELDYASYNLHGQLGLTRSEMFKMLDGEFWATLPKTKLANTIVSNLSLIGDVTLCTAACHESSEAAWGRFEWVNRWFPKLDLIAVQHKHLLANRASVLIDDLQANTDKFTAYCGRGILYPAPHNAMRNVKDPIDYLLRQF